MGRTTTITRPAYTPPGGTAITATTTTTYNAMGQPATTTDALGNTTSYTYDAFGRLLTRTEPDPDAGGPKAAPVWTYTYHRDGKVYEATDPVGAKNRTIFDAFGRVSKTSVSEGGASFYYDTLYGYDDADNLLSTTTPLAHTTTAVYNAAGEPTKVTDHTGRFTRASYDLAGRVVSAVSGQGSTYVNPVATTAWDFAGRAVSTSDCTASATGTCATVLRTGTATYDNAGRLLQATSPQGRPMYFGYDTAGQLTGVTQRVIPTNAATAITVGLGYDAAGNRTRMVDGNGNATTYTYTPWNLRESVIEPTTAAQPAAADRTWTTSYNANGLPVLEQLPGGVSRTMTYDRLGRMTGETGTGATTTARVLDYDPVGRPVSASSPAGNLTFTWTDRGLLASATGYGGTATYTYDGEALLTQRVDAAGTANFTYDGAGRLATVVDPLTGATATNTYDAAGRLASTSQGSGKSTRTYTYDN
jgi:YD repeat-containing protein